MIFHDSATKISTIYRDFPMPDLSHAASSEYWSQFFDTSIYRVICFLESVEDFTLDGHLELEKTITELGEALENIYYLDINQLKHEEIFIRLIANIKTSRGLRLLQAIDQAHPGSASKVIMYAESNAKIAQDPANIFLKRNLAFERLRLLSRVFSVTRIKLIIKALEGEE
jgi:intracellular multiplication protein IcmW